jgi:predicted permease
MDSYFQDVRYAVRALRGSPSVMLVAMACIGLGVGVSATMFSIADGILVQSLPFDEPDRLVNLGTTRTSGGFSTDPVLSYPDFTDWREQNVVFSDVAGAAIRTVTVWDDRETERYTGALVTWNLFSMTGVRPALGRGFRPEDDRPGAETVVIISDDIWRRRYGSDPSLVGRAILIDGQPHTVVGVMPAKFGFPFTQQLWMPLERDLRARSRAERSILAFARLEAGASLDQARADTARIADRLAAQYPDNRGWRAYVRPVRQMYNPPALTFTLLLLMAAGACVLLISCANIANLMLARATDRHHEMALRFALGAARGRVVRQVLVESVVLGVVSAPAGLGFAWLGVTLFDRAVAASSSNVPYVLEWGIDARVVAYTLAVTVVTGMLCGLAAALRAASGHPQDALASARRGTSGGGGRHRVRNALVVAEVAVSLVLLIGGGLFLRSFIRSYGDNGGIDVAPLMTMRLWLPDNTYDSPEAMARVVEAVVDRIEALPGVEAATASGLIPLEGGSRTAGALAEGRVVTPGEEPRVRYAGVTSHFFRALGVSLTEGRDFTNAEGATRSRVAVINRAMAASLWPSSGDVLGRQFRFTDALEEERFTVIGVASSINNEGLVEEREPVPSAYIPYAYMPERDTGLMVRVAGGDPAAVTARIRDAIHAVDAGLPLTSVRTMAQLRRDEAWAFNFVAWAFGILGTIALVLAAVGVYGVLAYSVAQRTYEIGLRMALGARGADVVRMIVWQGARLCGGGIALGLLGALAVAPLIGGALYQVSSSDPVTFVALAIFLSGVGLLASYVPARRASRVEPARTLRQG